MGNRLTEEDKSKQTSPHPYGDIFDELFPHYLIMGMTPEQYWDGGLNVKNTSRLPDYPDKPFLEKYEAEKKEADRKKQEEDRMKLTLALFQQGIMKFNKRMESAKKSEVSGQ